MKIKIYIVTYKGHKRLSPTLTSLFNSDITDYDFEVNIINNHTDIRIPENFIQQNRLHILHNSLRPDWSSGHLSRNWNQALINGFKSLTNPDCDLVVCSQDDSVFNPKWASRLIELHKDLDFIQNGHGDQFHSYTVEAVKKIGLWDERFCGISRQAADYFLRCLMYLSDKGSIQDPVHRRILNPIFNTDIDKSRNWLVSADVRDIEVVWDNTLHGNDSISQNLMLYKYGFDPYPWTDQLINNPPKKTLCDNFITYPYFEKDIYDLKDKGYLL